MIWLHSLADGYLVFPAPFVEVAVSSLSYISGWSCTVLLLGTLFFSVDLLSVFNVNTMLVLLLLPHSMMKVRYDNTSRVIFAWDYFGYP